MDLVAHLTDIDGMRKEQSLKKHCFQAAIYASENVGNAKLHYRRRWLGIRKYLFFIYAIANNFNKCCNRFGRLFCIYNSVRHFILPLHWKRYE